MPAKRRTESFDDFDAPPKASTERTVSEPTVVPQKEENRGTPGEPRTRLLALVEELGAYVEENWPHGRNKFRATTKLRQFVAYVNHQFPESEETE